MNKFKRIAAWIGIVILLGMYVCTLIFSLGKSEPSQAWFRASLACTIIVPVFLYIVFMVAKAVSPSKSPVIDTVVFDLINVLLDIPYQKVVDELPFSDEEKDAVREILRKDQIFYMMETGEWSYDRALAEAIKQEPQYEGVIRAYFEHYNDYGGPFPYTEEWIDTLKAKGYKVYLLSNWHDYAYEVFKEKHRIDFLGKMDGTVFSFRCHSYKPAAEMYQTLIRTYGIRPERAVFIDDREPNVKSAKEAGMASFVFTGYDDAKRQLALLGVK